MIFLVSSWQILTATSPRGHKDNDEWGCGETCKYTKKHEKEERKEEREQTGGAFMSYLRQELNWRWREREHLWQPCPDLFSSLPRKPVLTHWATTLSFLLILLCFCFHFCITSTNTRCRKDLIQCPYFIHEKTWGQWDSHLPRVVQLCNGTSEIKPRLPVPQVCAVSLKTTK